MVGSVFGFVPRVIVPHPKNVDPKNVIARRLFTLVISNSVPDGQAKRNTREKRQHCDHPKVA
jgi:hypothetical protein